MATNADAADGSGAVAPFWIEQDRRFRSNSPQLLATQYRN
jgi:hypothetical protein